MYGEIILPRGMSSLGAHWMTFVRAPSFNVFHCPGLHWSSGTCDTSLIIRSFKEGSHSPCLSSVPLGGYTSSIGELGTI